MRTRQITKQITKPAAVTLPLTALKCLYKSARGKKIVCEIDVAALKSANEPNTLDEMVAEARLEYFAGKTKAFTNTKQLLSYLNR
ncbi:MAG: hypothetical protein WC862_03145 [Patescibacteria group bacterium]